MELQQQLKQEVINQPVAVLNHSSFHPLLSQLWSIAIKGFGDEKHGSF